MPPAAWPGTVQRYSYVPAFLNVTLRVVDLCGRTIGLVLPTQLFAAPPFGLEQIFRSCES